MLVMGGLALIALFRDRGWRAEGALVAALAFAFGCSAAWRVQHVGQVISLSWFAVALWLLMRAIDWRERPRAWLWGAAAGLAAVIALLGATLAWTLGDRKSTRLNSSHTATSRMPSSA